MNFQNSSNPFRQSHGSPLCRVLQPGRRLTKRDWGRPGFFSAIRFEWAVGLLLLCGLTLATVFSFPSPASAGGDVMFARRLSNYPQPGQATYLYEIGPSIPLAHVKMLSTCDIVGGGHWQGSIGAPTLLFSDFYFENHDGALEWPVWFNNGLFIVTDNIEPVSYRPTWIQAMTGAWHTELVAQPDCVSDMLFLPNVL